MIEIYDYVANSDLIKKFSVDDFLFVEYKCLFPDDKVTYYTTSSYFVYVLGGRKKWITGSNEYDVQGGEGIFIKRGAYVAQKFHDDEFCALAIFIPDNFIETVVKKYTSQYPGKKIKKLAVVAHKKNHKDLIESIPCGACRQVILEFEERQKNPITCIFYSSDNKWIVSQSTMHLLPSKFSIS